MSVPYGLRAQVAKSLDATVRMDRLARALRPWWRMRFHSFGPGSVLVHPRWLVGCHHISIGEEVRIFRGAWLAAEPATWTSPNPRLVIGDKVVIRDDVVISATESIAIEPHVVLAGRCLLIDSDHTWEDGHPLITNNRSRTAPIRIRMGTWIGEQSIILRGTDIGAFSVVAANSVVRGNFPDFSVIAGTPAAVVGSTRSHLPQNLIDMVPPREEPSGPADDREA